MVPFVGWAMPGMGELVVIALIAFLLFGKRLPGQIKGLMQAIKEMVNGLQSIGGENENGKA